ncbi:hypothetical protein CN572_11350 [Bacillus wiedmannii]|uniref:hypothetical protein n=1 Tax=Bacillus wiedmannii TaxID=1890302 RepID=UPI000BF0AA45|nr:hypothetical protein [Bacillus wiedmannii]PEN46532.1 hypothetical protein CN630_14820 [Bacillus wiedmannii]PEN68605.1 hypothetical protein CN576_04035 [Bacillus wiedmannii]PEO74022.1 hypothetical protein CN572_11350 [Bacillus wiedmannii]PFZ64980.1 hypothetical protein COL76_13635 [Bacillus wiedmannii]PHE02586.1 hypothetical protein COF56_17620 [Bacillus wiedmannii]
MRYTTSQIRNLVILTSSFFLLSACGQQTSPTKTEATKQDTAVSKDSTKTEDSQKTEDSAKAENNAKTENNVKTENNTKAENNTTTKNNVKAENNTTTKNNAKTENNTKAENNTTTKNNAKTENNTKPEAESKNTQKEQQPAKQPNKQTDTITFTSEDAIKVLEKRMGARSNEIRYGSSEDKLIGTINGIKLYDVLYGRESAENSRALNFAVGSDGNLYDWSKAQDGILQPLNSN